MPSRIGKSPGKRPWTPELVRQRIRATKLVQRLQDHVHGLCEMSSTQVRAAEILLKKSIPDLSSIEHTGTAQPLTRETILERLAELHAAAVERDANGAAGAGTEPPGSASTH